MAKKKKKKENHDSDLLGIKEKIDNLIKKKMANMFNIEYSVLYL